MYLPKSLNTSNFNLLTGLYLAMATYLSASYINTLRWTIQLISYESLKLTKEKRGNYLGALGSKVLFLLDKNFN